ncbi:MAG: hypothetical protein FWC13_11665 [Oscillospiraceae bacterium]|nr:hypothetical protein [Oscillospiraceae bacterium]
MPGYKNEIVTARSVKMIATIISYTDGHIQGELDCRHFEEPFTFTSLMRMIEVMESTFDTKGQPEKHLLPRSFCKSKPRLKRHELDINECIKELRVDIGDSKANEKKASFEILVQFRYNAEWQGQIHWIERDTAKNFESIVELVKLIDNALKSTPHTQI